MFELTRGLPYDQTTFLITKGSNADLKRVTFICDIYSINSNIGRTKALEGSMLSLLLNL